MLNCDTVCVSATMTALSAATQPFVNHSSSRGLAIYQACLMKKHIGNSKGSWHLIRPYILYDKKELMLLGQFVRGRIWSRSRRARQ